ncbi:MAG: ribosome-binding ATPase YchF [Candidatus Parcubacteria bacterium]|nr:YchF family ATPase [Patescibacteria group bacterium]BCX16185.1 MAG: ribosome-binding ATPase YchF [Candidatus Parcubacteria bacterium]
MKLSLGIVGLPNVGKSTLFKLLTKNEVHIANYPFATIDPNVGVVAVPDERLDILYKLSRSAKKIPAIVEFYDIAGLVKGASQGQGLGNQFLSHIRETAAIVQVVRCFSDPEIIHIENHPDPLRDIDTINTELILKDLETVKKRIDKLEGEARTGNKEKIKELELVKRVESFLNEGKLLFLLGEEILNNPAIKGLNLLTAKKMIFLLNGEEKDVSLELKEKIAQFQSPYLVFDLKKEPDLSPLIKEAYKILDLISFFTTGEEETRAWTIKRGWKAPQAAGTIHTDFENKFIRAEVIFWKDLIEAGGWSQARQKGLIRIEGKDYIVQDGDVLFIRHG